jgi:hypothetical protein
LRGRFAQGHIPNPKDIDDIPLGGTIDGSKCKEVKVRSGSGGDYDFANVGGVRAGAIAIEAVSSQGGY